MGGRFSSPTDDDEPLEIDPLQLPAPKFVGSGLRGFVENPNSPQTYLEGSNHPYAPFPGNALKWESFVFDDGTSYEGLMREGIPHMKGVLVVGNGTGGGLDPAKVKRGDKYEGEFDGGFATGLGMFTAQSGEVYKGQYTLGKRHGCGALSNLAPFQKLIQQGVSPDKAWERVRQRVMDRTVYGRWSEDERIDKAPAEYGKPCSIPEIKLMLEEIDSIVTKARMFQHKPDGQVTIMLMQDAHGTPIPTMQDPMHYPHGTKFLAPGPMGQCFPVPDDEQLRDQLRQHARNAVRIHRTYNVPWEVEPESDMEKALILEEKRRAKNLDLFETEQDAEQRRLQRFAKLRQKRAGGMRGGWRPESNTLGVDNSAFSGQAALPAPSTSNSEAPAQQLPQTSRTAESRPSHAGPIGAVMHGAQQAGGAAAGAIQHLRSSAGGLLPFSRRQEP